MRIFIGADHRGFELKESLKTWLSQEGHEVIDCGNTVLEPTDDYPPFSFKVAESVSAEPSSKGILICGSGVGVTVAANKVRGARAALGFNSAQVQHAVEFDNINILSLSSDHFNLDQVLEMVSVFLKSSYSPVERLERRLNQISEYEERQS